MAPEHKICTTLVLQGSRMAVGGEGAGLWGLVFSEKSGWVQALEEPTSSVLRR